MNCDRHKTGLYSFVKGNMNEFEKKVLAEHRQECADCRKELHELKIIEAIYDECFPMIQLPANFTAGIMASVNLKKYKDEKKKKLRNLANIGMSMVAAGILMILLNFSPISVGDSSTQSSLHNTVNSISSKVAQPVNYINRGVSNLTGKLINLNGIFGRIETQIKGGK
ncbi:MAG: anti-sigma factor family protein [Bacillota bacterium]